jgi:hypothetical protein
MEGMSEFYGIVLHSPTLRAARQQDHAVREVRVWHRAPVAQLVGAAGRALGDWAKSCARCARLRHLGAAPVRVPGGH